MKIFGASCFLTLSIFFFTPVFGYEGNDNQESYNKAAFGSVTAAVSDDATLVEIFGRVIYLEGVTQSDWNRLWHSFFHGGILATAFSALALRTGIYTWARNYGSSGSMVVKGICGLSALFYIDALLTRGWLGFRLLYKLFNLENTATYFVMAAWMLTGEDHDPENYISNFFNKYVLLLLPFFIKFRHEYLMGDTELSNSEYVALSGDVAKQFIIKAVPALNNIAPYYELRPVASMSEVSGNDSYSRLANIMRELKLGKLKIQRLKRKIFRTADPERKNFKEGTTVLVSFFYQADNKLAFQGYTILNWEEGQPSLLLDDIREDLVIIPMDGIRCLLFPEFIGKVADRIQSIKVGKNREQSENIMPFYFGMAEAELNATSLTYDADTDRISYSVPGSENEKEVTLSLGLQDNSIFMATGCKDETNCVAGQHVVPVWFNKVILLELAYLGYHYGEKLFTAGINGVMPVDKAIPLYAVKDYAGSEPDCPVCKNAPSSVSEDALSLQNLPCNHPICSSCLDAIIKQEVSKVAKKFWQLGSFGVPCPMCRAKAEYLISP
ncbi:RING finger protein [Endozoicomonas euniceicola]|uniref:RING-type domain-containing protein n=1 Tax=Endozoicomonas euniceicola TaxID=1234143 RepID=A0ABY6GSI7_9GAMM|nr:hypothetical protein [Endozoicomonas euniceicola]UYM15715.1 hypothetical protein NX720_23275 [Endozoicomonas euniceicola]